MRNEDFVQLLHNDDVTNLVVVASLIVVFVLALF